MRWDKWGGGNKRHILEVFPTRFANRLDRGGGRERETRYQA